MNAPAKEPMVRRRPVRAEGIHPSYVDIMCCLVILFLLTSLLATTGVVRPAERQLPPVNLPQVLDQPGATPLPSQEQAVLTVLPGPEFRLNTEVVAKGGLPHRLKAARLIEIVIRGDAAVPYGQVMEAFDACQQAGISQVSLTYQPKGQQP